MKICDFVFKFYKGQVKLELNLLLIYILSAYKEGIYDNIIYVRVCNANQFCTIKLNTFEGVKAYYTSKTWN